MDIDAHGVVLNPAPAPGLTRSNSLHRTVSGGSRLQVATSGSTASAVCTMDRRRRHEVLATSHSVVRTPSPSPSPNHALVVADSPEKRKLEDRRLDLARQLAELELKERELALAEEQLIQRTAGVRDLRRILVDIDVGDVI